MTQDVSGGVSRKVVNERADPIGIGPFSSLFALFSLP